MANSDWGADLPAGQGVGVACHTYHDTPVALVARVRMGDKSFRVERVVCAVDCGTVVNPDMVVQQIEGGVAFGLTAVLKGALTHKAGRIEQQNFNDSPLLQLTDMPQVDVHIVPGPGHPTGVGEMAVPVGDPSGAQRCLRGQSHPFPQPAARLALIGLPSVNTEVRPHTAMVDVRGRTSPAGVSTAGLVLVSPRGE